ncbi:zinc finger protein [Nephila pilipes]|uniref:Zinc finger protein n=1 Tax=Nephila pilipes TaxID=299642 RepID=A0A8X6MWX6_NEPPI|nr:zinc finger protein [Nephila pilipes]
MQFDQTCKKAYWRKAICLQNMWKRLHSEEKSGLSYSIASAEKSTCMKEDCDILLSRNEVIENINVTTYSCRFCDYSTIDKSNMKRHMRQHTGERPYVCRYCGKVRINLPGFFKEDSSAERTVSPTSKGPPILTCHFCEYVTVHRTNLNTHLRRHTGERPFKCGICGKGVQSSAPSLENVVRKFVAKSKLYDCNQCRYVTNHKGNFTKHMRIHTGERPFVCYICGRGFTQKQAMLSHIISHKV